MGAYALIHVVLWLWSGRRFLWGRYKAAHLNRVAAMIRENLSIPHEIVAITDMPEGIDPSIRIVPLWPDLADQGRCFRRLKLFEPGDGAIDRLQDRLDRP